jgi:DNA-binding transcriptional LysR family regulator
MVAEGLGVTFLYETLIFHDNYKKRPIYIPFQEKTLSVPLVLASSRYELSNATQAFISLVKEIYSNPSFVGNRSVVYTNWTSFGKDQEV